MSTPLTSAGTIVLVALAACTTPHSLAPDEEVLVLEVAAETVACVGEMEQRCLRVRAPGDDSWRNFYAPIEGFEHEEGVAYTIEVARREVEDPPQDASSYAYRLLRILEREPA